MNLIIDIGNTTSKYAVFENSEMVNVSVFSNTAIDELKNYISQYPQLSKAIFCSVSNNNDTISEYEDALSEANYNIEEANGIIEDAQGHAWSTSRWRGT